MITNDNLHQAIAALRQCAKENENRQTDTGAIRVNDLCSDVADYLEGLHTDPVPTKHDKMDVERWKEACKAACSDRNYRSHFGLTETRDDYFVDGVQWADENPALTWTDMMRIHRHIKDAMNFHLYELQNGIEGQQKVYQNVLDRFLKEKKVWEQDTHHHR